MDSPDAAIGAQVPAYADLGPRLGAAVLDGLIQFGLAIGSSMCAALILRILVFIGALTDLSADHDPAREWEGVGLASRLAVIVAFVVSSGLFYRPLCESSGMQATVGKRLFGVMVTDRTGGRLTLLRALGRTLARGVAVLFPLALPTMVCIAVRKDRRGPHDFFAGTVNVLGKAPGEVGLVRILVILVVPIWWVALTMIAVFF